MYGTIVAILVESDRFFYKFFACQVAVSLDELNRLLGLPPLFS